MKYVYGILIFLGLFGLSLVLFEDSKEATIFWFAGTFLIGGILGVIEEIVRAK